MSLLIINGKLVTEAGIIEKSLRIQGEQIAEIGDLTILAEDEVIDAQGAFVLPGGVDPHTHLELQQSEEFRSADDFYSGTVAAALGGTTTIIDHIGFGPVGCDLHYSLDRYHEKAKKAVVDYSFHGVIQHVDDSILAELKTLIEDEGIASFKAYSTYGFKIDDASLLKAEFLEAGLVDAIWHARSRPARVESEYIGRVCELAAIAGNAPVYIVHTSTALGAKRIQTFQAEGVPVFMETCPQYLLLTEAKYTEGGNAEGIKYIMAPPLREDSDREALWQALSNGSRHTIGTDHCPFCYAEKAVGLQDFSKAPGGAPGVEERLPLLFSEGVLKGRITLEQFTELVSTNPAKLLGLYPKKGTIKVGSDADLVILREGPAKTIHAKTQASVCDYSIYEGMTHHCQIDYVLSRGEIIVHNGLFKGHRGRGKFQPRAIDGKYLNSHEN